MGHNHPLHRASTRGEGQHQEVQIRGQPGHQGHKPGVQAIPEVRHPATAREEVAHILQLATVRASPPSGHPYGGQPAPEGEDVVYQLEQQVCHGGGGRPEDHSLHHTLPQSRGHLAFTLVSGGVSIKAT
jgi:hypothetical protein